MTIKDELVRARSLIQQQRYSEARAVLNRVDHPVAKDWLAKLNSLESSGAAAPRATPAPGAGRASMPAGDNFNSPAYVMTDAAPARRRGRLPLTGLILLLLMAVVGGAAVGAALHFSGRYLYLIFVSVILAAALIGGLMTVPVTYGRVRSGAAAFIFGLLAGVIVYNTYWVLDYTYQMQLWREEYRALEGDAASDEMINRLIDSFILEEETGSTGFVGYVRLTIQEGLNISDASDSITNPSEEGMNIGTELTIGYYVLEILIITLGPAFFAASRTDAPFCDDTGRYMRFQGVGGVKREEADQFLSLLQADNFVGAGALMGKRGGVIQVEIGRCQPTSPTAIMKVKQQQGRSTKEIFNGTISGAQADALTSGRMQPKS